MSGNSALTAMFPPGNVLYYKPCGFLVVYRYTLGVQILTELWCQEIVHSQPCFHQVLLKIFPFIHRLLLIQHQRLFKIITSTSRCLEVIVKWERLSGEWRGGSRIFCWRGGANPVWRGEAPTSGEGTFQHNECKSERVESRWGWGLGRWDCVLQHLPPISTYGDQWGWVLKK